MTDEPTTPASTPTDPTPTVDPTPGPAVEPAPVLPDPVLPPADPGLMGEEFRGLPDDAIHHG
jgi:hypothetical protein